MKKGNAVCVQITVGDIFWKPNTLKLKLQGKDTYVIQLHGHLKAFVSKLQNWCLKVVNGNIAMFDRLTSATCNEESEEISKHFKTSVAEHHQYMESLSSYVTSLNSKNKELH